MAMTHKHHPYIFVTGIFSYEGIHRDGVMVSLCIYHERVPVWRTEGTYEVFTYVEIDMSP